jgi:hypothetical protein
VAQSLDADALLMKAAEERTRGEAEERTHGEAGVRTSDRILLRVDAGDHSEARHIFFLFLLFLLKDEVYRKDCRLIWILLARLSASERRDISLSAHNVRANSEGGPTSLQSGAPLPNVPVAESG